MLWEIKSNTSQFLGLLRCLFLLFLIGYNLAKDRHRLDHPNVFAQMRVNSKYINGHVQQTQLLRSGSVSAHCYWMI